ncbi:MAG: formylglycine-generating enzyme family protein [Planctomycetes bacterium]|nr:formylglycine-generating enzyme family protein [Planctomycetota bacterium]
MNQRPLLVVVAVLLGFIAWGGWNLMRRSSSGPTEVTPPKWEPVAASADELRSALPSWAEALPETALDPVSGLPTPVRDPRTGLVYVLVPAGETVIGDSFAAGYSNELARYEDPPSTEFLTTRFDEAFYLGREEVSFGQWKRYLAVQDPPLSLAPEAEQRLSAYPDDRPMILVTRLEAASFAAWAGGRLPSELEWEYASKGDAPKLRFPWGSNLDCGDARLQVDLEEIIGDDEAGLLARALLPCGTSERDRSWCGARDLAGNAAEWIAVPWRLQVGRSTLEDAERPDLFAKYGAVVRGGSWASPVGAGRCTQRDRLRDGERYDFVGFRVMRKP